MKNWEIKFKVTTKRGMARTRTHFTKFVCVCELAACSAVRASVRLTARVCVRATEQAVLVCAVNSNYIY